MNFNVMRDFYCKKQYLNWRDVVPDEDDYNSD